MREDRKTEIEALRRRVRDCEFRALDFQAQIAENRKTLKSLAGAVVWVAGVAVGAVVAAVMAA